MAISALPSNSRLFMHRVLYALPTFLEFLALWLAVGAVAYRLWILPARLPAAVGSAIERLLFWSLLGLGGSALITLVARTAGMSGSPVTELGPVLPQLLLETHFGTVWIVRASTILVLCGAWYAAGREWLSRDVRPLLMMPALVVIAWTHSASGHAADQGDFTLIQCIDSLHIVATSMWGGSLLAFTLAVRGDFLRCNAPEKVTVAKRLSRLATIALAGVLATGLYNTYHQLGAPAALFESTYGTLLLIKLALVMAMLGLAAINRYVHLPLMRAPDYGIEPVSANALTRSCRFSKILTIESILALGVLLCAAMLTQEPPPVSLK